MKMTDKAIAQLIDVSPVTFSRWKKDRPELYERVRLSFELEHQLEGVATQLEQIFRGLRGTRPETTLPSSLSPSIEHYKKFYNLACKGDIRATDLVRALDSIKHYENDQRVYILVRSLESVLAEYAGPSHRLTPQKYIDAKPSIMTHLDAIEALIA